MSDHRPCTARNETPLERADRNFGELLQELRVTQTGVQILFAFLLSLAFTPRFPDLDTVQRTTYVTTLLLAVLAAALFTAPAALHRSLFQKGAKPRIVQVSSRLASVGMGVLVLAFTGSVLLVVDVTTSRAGGVAAGAATLLVCLGLWGLLPRLVLRAGAAEEQRTADERHETVRPPAHETVRPQAPVRAAAPHRELSARRR
jgi:small-conductance mechanosensitive channel